MCPGNKSGGCPQWWPVAVQPPPVRTYKTMEHTSVTDTPVNSRYLWQPFKASNIYTPVEQAQSILRVVRLGQQLGCAGSGWKSKTGSKWSYLSESYASVLITSFY